MTEPIVITKEDVERLASSEASRPHVILPPVVVISREDVQRAEAGILRITPAMIAAVRPAPVALRIEAKDCPDAPASIRIMLEDVVNLPPSVLEEGPITEDNFHGTSSGVAERILREGWIIGSGNAIGSGIYFSVGAETHARSYARPELIHARIAWGKIAHWDDPKVQQEYTQWCREHRCTPCGDAITEWALATGYRTLLQSKTHKPTIGVFLYPQTARTGRKLVTPHIRILEVKDVNTGRVRTPH